MSTAQLDWFIGTGLLNPKLTINNGIDASTCLNDGGIIWTYNQGVILSGLVELYRATNVFAYLCLAEVIASAAIRHLTDKEGTLYKPCEPSCGADGPQFKGIFMRGLGKLLGIMRSNGSVEFEEFVRRNAESIWEKGRGDGEPFEGADATTQSSVVDALVAAMGVEKGQGAKVDG